MDGKRYIVDFDGTLISEDLEREFMRYLLKQPEVKFKMLLVSVFTLPVNMLRNRLGFPSVYKSWTYVLQNDISLYITRFVSQHAGDIHLREDVWEKIAGQEHVTLLSGCYRELLVQFLHKIERRKVFEQIIGCEVELDYFHVRLHPYGRGKCQFVDAQDYTVGIANDHSDRYYMQLCNEQIYV